ncbi:MAG TPA: hypothetical protein VF516_28370 [Kofleriaceae bacterium]
MNKRMLSMITALTVAAATFGTAGADTVPANMGKATVGAQTGLFNYNTMTGAVTAFGFAGLRSWQVGLPLDIFGPKLVTVTSHTTNPLFGPTWRIVTSNAVGTGFGASATAPIPLSPLFLPITRGIPFVVPGGVCSVVASMNAGSSIAVLNYNM